MNAHVVVNKPRYSDARAVFPPRKSEISSGMIGTTMPRPTMSSMTVTKMKPSAAGRLADMGGLLQLWRNRVQRFQPQIYGSIHTLSVMRRAIIEHESTKSGKHNGSESACLRAVLAFVDCWTGNEFEPILDRGVQEIRIPPAIPQRERICF